MPFSPAGKPVSSPQHKEQQDSQEAGARDIMVRYIYFIRSYIYFIRIHIYFIFMSPFLTSLVFNNFLLLHLLHHRIILPRNPIM